MSLEKLLPRISLSRKQSWKMKAFWAVYSSLAANGPVIFSTASRICAVSVHKHRAPASLSPPRVELSISYPNTSFLSRILVVLSGHTVLRHVASSALVISVVSHVFNWDPTIGLHSRLLTSLLSTLITFF